LDRINRPEQIIAALPEVMRVLTRRLNRSSHLIMPQDVQAMAFDYPSQLLISDLHIGATGLIWDVYSKL